MGPGSLAHWHLAETGAGARAGTQVGLGPRMGGRARAGLGLVPETGTGARARDLA